MLCPKCGYYSEIEETICPECGQILKQTPEAREGGAQAIRQGRRARETAKTRVPRTEETASKKDRITVKRDTVQMPVIRDTRGSGESRERQAQAETASFERRRRTVYDEDADEITAMRYLAAHEGSGSVSRLELFASCAYEHFLQYGLRLAQREIYEVKAADLGTVFHKALDLFFENILLET